MTKVLEGVRVIEVSTMGFVPSAAAVLADWGADVIKVEHPVHGDAIRGANVWGVPRDGAQGLMFLWEIFNRGKRSIGIDLNHPPGLEVLLRLVDSADVFMTSFLPPARRRIGIDADDVMKRNPSIVYARGSGRGPSGPLADEGGFDALCFWARSGMASAVTPDDASEMITMPAPGFGDGTSGMVLAGGISAALAYRERTGKGVVVDVSLLAAGMWAMQAPIAATKLIGRNELRRAQRGAPARPALVDGYRTKDGRYIALSFDRGDRYWKEFCAAVDRPDLVEDPTLASDDARYADMPRLVKILEDLFATRTYDEWIEALSRQPGPWDPVQRAGELHDDPQVQANGYIVQIDAGEGRTVSAVAAPAQFDQTPPEPTRAPEHAAHTDEILLEAGYSWDEIIQLKVDAAIT